MEIINPTAGKNGSLWHVFIGILLRMMKYHCRVNLGLMLGDAIENVF
jgi:hypothetical protein